MNNRFYANVQGSDTNAILACLKKANEITQSDSEITCIVLYSYTKNNFSTVAQIFGDDNLERMFSFPLRFEGITKPVRCLTARTYKDWHQPKSIFICCHMKTEDVQKVDDCQSAKYIMVVSWLKDGLAGWANRWNAECIYGEKVIRENADNDNLALLRIAMQEMDIRMFQSKDFHHTDDENTCKTYIRTIHKYMPEVTAVQIEKILITELKWSSGNAIKVGELLNRLKNGRTFQGGEKTGLASYYKRWKEESKPC